MASSSQNIYCSIRRAKTLPPGSRFNLIAKTSEISVPRKSAGSDYFVTLKLVDLTERTSEFSVNVFEEKLELLPLFKSPGDIISLHRIETRIYEGRSYGTFKRKLSSFALFDGGDGGDLTPYLTSSTIKYKATRLDVALMLNLRTLPLPEQDEEFKPLLLCNVEPGIEQDILCKVLYVCRTSTHKWMLLAWDGTDACPITPKMDLNFEEEIPIHHEISLSQSEPLFDIPIMGSILEIYIDKDFEGLCLLEGGGHWVKFCNIIFDIHSGVWRGVIHSVNKARVCFIKNHDVLHRQRLYEDRLASPGRGLPIACFDSPSITTYDFDDSRRYSTLRESIINPEDIIEFRCVVRFIASYPWRAENLRCQNGQYSIKFILEDPTAIIYAFITDIDAARLFGRNPSLDKLKRKICRLLGMMEGGGGSRNPPWLCCCLRSYRIGSIDEPLGGRRYQIFGTTLIK